MDWAMVIVVVTVQAVVIIKTVISEPSAAKMASVMCEAGTIKTAIPTKPNMAAANAAHVLGTKAARVNATKAANMATTKAAHMAAAEASAPDVTAATAEASAPHVTAAAPTATRVRSGRQQAAGKQRCYQYHHQSFDHDTSFFSERSVWHAVARDWRNAQHSDVPMS
jgi:hypothetical protein